jgi:hypothetical protein
MHISGAESLTMIHVDDPTIFFLGLTITMLGCKEVSSYKLLGAGRTVRRS